MHNHSSPVASGLNSRTEKPPSSFLVPKRLMLIHLRGRSPRCYPSFPAQGYHLPKDKCHIVSYRGWLRCFIFTVHPPLLLSHLCCPCTTSLVTTSNNLHDFLSFLVPFCLPCRTPESPHNSRCISISMIVRIAVVLLALNGMSALPMISRVAVLWMLAISQHALTQ